MHPTHLEYHLNDRNHGSWPGTHGWYASQNINCQKVIKARNTVSYPQKCENMVKIALFRIIGCPRSDWADSFFPTHAIFTCESKEAPFSRISTTPPGKKVCQKSIFSQKSDSLSFWTFYAFLEFWNMFTDKLRVQKRKFDGFWSQMCVFTRIR